MDWSLDQLHLCAWLEFYHNIRSIPDGAPAEGIIENDYLLDKWIKEYNLKKRAEENKSGTAGRKTSASGHANKITFGRRDK